MTTRKHENRYCKALGYFQNAGEILRTKANKKGTHYQDEKYVRLACNSAYKGTLIALETYLELQGEPIRNANDRRKISVHDYRENLSVVDNQLLTHFNTVYNVLHLSAFWIGCPNVAVIHSGIESALEVLGEIRPPGVQATRLKDLIPYHRSSSKGIVIDRELFDI